MKHAIVLSLIAVLASSAMAASFTDFESFSDGSVDGQGGWSATGTNFDQEVVTLGDGNKVWRISNSYTSGSFGDQPFSAPSGQYHGETGAVHPDGQPVTTNRFYASFDFWSVTSDYQPGMDVTVSPDDGQGGRQSFISINNTSTGLNIDFYDTAGNNASNPNGGFAGVAYIAEDLSFTQKHNLAFEIVFNDGNIFDGTSYYGNDIVNIYLNGSLIHSGTTWESYWWTTTEGRTPPTVTAIDSLLFRVSSGSANDGEGLYIDNVLITDVAAAPVPEPLTMVALFGGVSGLAGYVRRRRRA